MPLLDDFLRIKDTAESPARSWAVLTKNDTKNLTRIPKAIMSNSDGMVSCAGLDNVSVVFSLKAGVALPIRPMRINVTGTDAIDVIGLY